MNGQGRDGLLLVDKPTGPTSHDIVHRVRRASGVRRVGHAGTLDPLASGLLPLVLGRATRLVRFLPHSPKTYTGRLQLGRTTNTDDVTGEILSDHEGALPGAEQVLAAARKLEGRQFQIPPAFSARRVEGRRLYELARKGQAVEARPTEIVVTRFTLSPTDSPETYEFTAEVSNRLPHGFEPAFFFSLPSLDHAGNSFRLLRISLHLLSVLRISLSLESL